jgi:Glycosyltransferase Family 4
MPGNVLIVTQNFPPTNEIAARRFGYLVPYLEQHGWTPWVLTTHGSGPLPVRIPPERVFRIGRNLNRVLAAGDGASANPTGGVLPRVRAGARAAARWAVDLTGSRIYALYPANLEWYREVLRHQNALRRWLPEVDIVIGSFMPAGALRIAAFLARTLGVPWLADVRDIASMLPGRRNPLARRADRWIERWLFRTAAGFITVSPTLARILESRHGRPARVIYNGWDSEPESAAEPTRARGPAHRAEATSAGNGYLYYAGLLYAHRMPAAGLILEALRHHPGVVWKLRSLGPADLEAQLVAQARRLGVAGRLEILPPADPAVVMCEGEAALANVVLEDIDCRNPAGRGTLTGKFLKLLPARPAVLAVARSDSDIGPILVRSGKGRLCSTSGEIVAFLKAIARDPRLFHGDAAAIAPFSMPAQAAALARVLDERRAA